MIYEERDYEPDVLAVLVRGKITITFVTAPASSIDGKNYEVVSWSESDMTICISDEYLNYEIDRYIVDGITDNAAKYQPTDEEEFVREHAIRLLSTRLTELLTDAVNEVK